jgi:DNA-directed RNA polymerase I subunit RPA34.5
MKAVSGDLTDKQVWHITAPASIPLTLIKGFDLDAVRSGNPILVHEQRHYALFTGSKDPQQLLLPAENGCSYRRSKASISKSYHLREIPNQSQPIVADKEQSADAPAFFAKAPPRAKGPREQPKMLRMRYTPFGIKDNTTAPTSIGETQDPEESGPQPPSQNSSPISASTPKRKKKGESPQRMEQDGLVDDPMPIDESPAQGSMARERNSQADLPGLEMSKDMNGIAVDQATLREKKRKKKKRMHEGALS